MPKRKTPPPPPTTPAQAFADRYHTTYHREIAPGFVVEMKKLALTDELLRGTLPNAVLERVLWESDDDGDDSSPKTKYKARYEGFVAIAARALVAPRLVVRGAPDYTKNEIAPGDLNYVELYNIWYYAIKEVVPPAQAAPFRSQRAVPSRRTGAAARPGDDLSPPQP